jgi:hypothetical protein
MFVFAVACDRYDQQVVRRLSGWAGPYVAVSLALAVLSIRALVSYAANLGLSPGYALVAQPGATGPDLVTRFAIRRWSTPPDEAAEYAGRTRRRLAIKPGLTGSGRSAGNQICPGSNRAAA